MGLGGYMKSLYTPKQMTSWVSIYLNKQGYETEIYSDLFLPARVPVYARKELNGKKKFLKNLKFDEDPISFLLIFCDTIQEWGRVGRDYEKTAARLDDIGVEEDLVWANISVGDEESFNKKKEEIDRVKKFLKDERFKINLASRKGLGSINVEIYMEGK